MLTVMGELRCARCHAKVERPHCTKCKLLFEEAEVQRVQVLEDWAERFEHIKGRVLFMQLGFIETVAPLDEDKTNRDLLNGLPHHMPVQEGEAKLWNVSGFWEKIKRSDAREKIKRESMLLFTLFYHGAEQYALVQSALSLTYAPCFLVDNEFTGFPVQIEFIMDRKLDTRFFVPFSCLQHVNGYKVALARVMKALYGQGDVRCRRTEEAQAQPPQVEAPSPLASLDHEKLRPNKGGKANEVYRANKVCKVTAQTEVQTEVQTEIQTQNRAREHPLAPLKPQIKEPGLRCLPESPVLAKAVRSVQAVRAMQAVQATQPKIKREVIMVDSDSEEEYFACIQQVKRVKLEKLPAAASSSETASLPNLGEPNVLGALWPLNTEDAAHKLKKDTRRESQSEAMEGDKKAKLTKALQAVKHACAFLLEFTV